MTRSKVLEFLKENVLDVFPLKGKIPTCKWTEPFNGEIQSDQNFGVKLGGKSQIIVIDVDDYSLVEHFKKFFHVTYVVKTGKGFHIYIKVKSLPPIGRLNNSKGQHIDIQSTGTYVVGETSIHPETKNEYQMISDKREINEINFEEINVILEKLGFKTTKKPFKENKSDAIKNGVSKGSRNNSMFALACDFLKILKDPELAYNTITTINEKNNPPLPKEEIDVIFASATDTVQLEIEENKNKFQIDRDTEIELLEENPQQMRAITLDEVKNRHILVYLPANEIDKKTGIKKFFSKAFIISNGINGKQILPLEDPFYQENFFTTLFTEFRLFSNKFSLQSITDYIQSKEKIDPKTIFENLLNMERKYFENEFDYDYYFEACWKTHTYFYTLFDHTPYDDYFGMKNVGKSKRLKLSKMICYNGLLTGDASVSSIFRTIEGTGATLLLDETENLQGKREDRTDLENLLRNGYSKEGQVTRSKEGKNKDFKPEVYSVFSPKAFGHIYGMDNVLEDRNLKTTLTRTTIKEIADSEPDENDNPLIKETRESLYKLFLDYGDEIFSLIPEAKSLFSEISGRELSLWLPIVTMALFYEKHGAEGIIQKIQAKMETISEEKRVSDSEQNEDVMVLQCLEKIHNTLGSLPDSSRPLYDAINGEMKKEFDYDEKLSDRKLKPLLERIGFKCKRHGAHNHWNNLTPEQIHKAKVKVGLILPTQATLENVDSTHENVGNVGSVAN